MEQLCFFVGKKPAAHHSTELFFKPSQEFSFKPGQYVSIILPQLAGEETADQFHDFSIASDNRSAPDFSIITRNSDSIFKKALLSLDKGAELDIEGPAGNFLLPETDDVLWIAGGVGITPFLSMLRSGQADKKRVRLLYVNSSPERIIARDEIAASGLQAEFIGRPDIARSLKRQAAKPYGQVMAAGSPSMVSDVTAQLEALGVPRSTIITEEFPGYDRNA